MGLKKKKIHLRFHTDQCKQYIKRGTDEKNSLLDRKCVEINRDPKNSAWLLSLLLTNRFTDYCTTELCLSAVLCCFFL